MFTRQDIQKIDRDYFTVKSAGCHGVMLQSKNTKHCWYISHEDYGRHQTCTIYHTHHEGASMHRHGHGRDIRSCMEQIKSHDRYQLKKDTRKRCAAASRRFTAGIGNENPLTV